MFKKNERLSKSEFSEYFKVGKKHHFPHVTIITHPLPIKKVAVVVGKKVAKSAVRRNTLSRRVNAVLKSELPKTSLSLIIVIVKPGFNTLTKANAQKVICEAIAQVAKRT